MSQEHMSYPPISAIRQLLLAAFTGEGLERFCQDRPLLRPVLNEFGPGYSKADMVTEVIKYCDTQMLWDELLREVGQARPRQYEPFWHRLPPEVRRRCPPPPDQPTSRGAPLPWWQALGRQRWFWPAVIGVVALVVAAIVIPRLIPGEDGNGPDWTATPPGGTTAAPSATPRPEPEDGTDVFTPSPTPTATGTHTASPTPTATPTETFTPTPSPIPEAKISIRAHPTEIDPEECAILQWDVSNARFVTMNEIRVPFSGTEEACPGRTTTYTWQVQGLDGEMHEQSIEISVNPLPSWSALSEIDAPSGSAEGFSGVWTGSEMIVWGGYLTHVSINSDRGASYDPTTNSWFPILPTTDGWPEPRSSHSAVWTGSEMIIWGGYYDEQMDCYDTGARYNPDTGSWTRMDSTSAPQARGNHTAVWTGSEMIIWGGECEYWDDAKLNSGGRYDARTDRWAPVPKNGAPSPRVGHTAIWTGSEMIIWGGTDGTQWFNDGARYNPEANTWTYMSRSGVPDPRSGHTAVWTGTEMIVWGGYQGMLVLGSGARYNPDQDTWTPVSFAGAPEPRSGHVAVWTGSKMIVWGGEHLQNTGGRYSPSTDRWIALPRNGAPLGAEGAVGIWTGTEFLVWGSFLGDNVYAHEAMGGRLR